MTIQKGEPHSENEDLLLLHFCFLLNSKLLLPCIVVSAFCIHLIHNFWKENFAQIVLALRITKMLVRISYTLKKTSWRIYFLHTVSNRKSKKMFTWKMLYVGSSFLLSVLWEDNKFLTPFEQHIAEFDIRDAGVTVLFTTTLWTILIFTVSLVGNTLCAVSIWIIQGYHFN